MPWRAFACRGACRPTLPRRADMAKDPCIGVCKFSKKTGLCKGCLRTRDEKRDWKRMGAAGRRAAAERILERMATRLARCV